MTKRALVSSGGGPVGIAWETGGYDRVLMAPIRIAGDDETAFPRAAAAQLDAGMREGRDAVGELTGLWH